MTDETDPSQDVTPPVALEPGKERRAWRLMAAAGCVLASASILLTAVKWSTTDTRVDRNASTGQKAICAIIVYAESNADIARAGDPTARPPRPPNPEAADNLDDLARRMRKTGISCP